ncbi:MAG: signal peptidase II [Candidatus Nanopelagicaceae bacterium]
MAWLIWLADYLTKQWALNYLPGKDVKVLGNFLQLQLSYNTGAAFGLGAEGAGVLLALFAIAASCLVVYYAPFLTSRAWAICFALLLGGAIGNLTDRAFNYPGLFRGAVTDWIKLPNWPNFNLADSCIVIAAILAFLLTAKNINPINRNSDDLDGAI